MLFEVLFDGKVRASTSYLECIPTKNTLLDTQLYSYTAISYMPGF